MSKKALLVGINSYADPANDLRGCRNDVQQMRTLLTGHFGFGARAVRLLLDRHATGAGIREGLQWLVEGSAAGDLLVFHYSGHGSQVADRSGDEQADGLDELICPHDMNWDDPFTDDELGELARGVSRGASLTVVLDCCHAGTGLREMAFPSAHGGVPCAPTVARCLLPPAALGAGAAGNMSARTAGTRRRFGGVAAAAGALLVAACRDDQVSADAFIEGDYHGALTYYLGEALAAASFAASYERLVDEVRRRLRREGFDQVPQLEGARGLRRCQAFSAPEPAFAGR
jgi:hypothetical protein